MGWLGMDPWATVLGVVCAVAGVVVLVGAVLFWICECEFKKWDK